MKTACMETPNHILYDRATLENILLFVIAGTESIVLSRFIYFGG